MDYVVGEASKGALAAGEKNFNLVGGRVLLDAFEDVGGLIYSKHSALSIQHSAFSQKLGVGATLRDWMLIAER
jgi:hypothetical protein